MKAALILTTLLGAAIASPVAIANVEATEAEKRDLKPRLVQTTPISVVVAPPYGSVLSDLKLAPFPTETVNKGNIIEVLATFLRGILGAGRNLDTGFDRRLGIPSTSTLRNNPVSAITNGNITTEQLVALVEAIKAEVKAVAGIGQGLPSGLDRLQLQQTAGILTVIQQVLGPILDVLGTLTSSGTRVPGSAAPLGDLLNLNDTLTKVLKTVTDLLDGLSSTVGGVGNLVKGLFGGTSLDEIMRSLP
ncbi:hypothetical protein LX36DRAFT_748544 [Colletotrichum falcatum]|nr:hypothetical protein LX36DRAFT_748544 [Colletotrichum falcatum]